ncbi:MAG: alpha-D-glucose phosphate-specific phosphoglucomutase [Pseudonocardia sp.]|nr:alpha-D-glucose phosphate-specific phosphoglucomutase [Pseudonocardia sp.]
MAVHPRAGCPASAEDLIDVNKLNAAYREIRPDPSIAEQRVAFGTSGHRGSSLTATFNDDHIAAISQAICEYRAAHRVAGPLFIGRDTHALSEPALATAVEVFAANEVTVLLDMTGGYTPTPAVSHAILTYNARPSPSGERADGVVITPSHNPPPDGGFKYNPPHGGPADTDATRWIAGRANELLEAGLTGVRRMPVEKALNDSEYVRRYDFLGHYVDDLDSVLDLNATRAAGVRIGADPLGGASVGYWGAIAERYRLELTVVNPDVDPRFGFMTLDWDGKIRMDCSSPYAMASLVARKADFQVATGNDADADRHGIVTADGGLMNPNHFLAVAIDYLYRHRTGWPAGACVGKTAVSSLMIDRVAEGLGRRLLEVPVGFKWFVPGLLDAAGEQGIGFGGEESAGASFLRTDGTVWTTDKDGIIMALLAAEIIAITQLTPSQRYRELTERYGDPSYARVDVTATREAKSRLALLSPADVTATELAGEKIVQKLTAAPGNGAPLGGLKVVTESGWFAARPSGTEDVYKIYAESFAGPEHLADLQGEARELVASVLAAR